MSSSLPFVWQQSLDVGSSLLSGGIEVHYVGYSIVSIVLLVPTHTLRDVMPRRWRPSANLVKVNFWSAIEMSCNRATCIHS